jgi:hypothetical protein
MESIEQALAAWTGFYGYLGAVAATLLGLLFVSVSLRLNIFQEHEVRDVRDFAFLTFGSFFCLVLVAGVFLVPHQTRLGLGMPLALFGLLGVVGTAYVGPRSPPAEYRRKCPALVEHGCVGARRADVSRIGSRRTVHHRRAG